MFMERSDQSILKRAWHETGGKCPRIVIADCDALGPATKLGAFLDGQRSQATMGRIGAAKATARRVSVGERLTLEGKCSCTSPAIFGDVGQNDAMANDSINGLATSVPTDNLGRAIRVSEGLKAGTVSAKTPKGWIKLSGFGRELSLHSLDKFTSITAS